MYVRIRINDKDVNVMLDLGVTYLFVADRLVKKLNL